MRIPGREEIISGKKIHHQFLSITELMIFVPGKKFRERGARGARRALILPGKFSVRRKKHERRSKGLGCRV